VLKGFSGGAYQTTYPASERSKFQSGYTLEQTDYPIPEFTTEFVNKFDEMFESKLTLIANTNDTTGVTLLDKNKLLKSLANMRNGTKPAAPKTSSQPTVDTQATYIDDVGDKFFDLDDDHDAFDLRDRERERERAR
jgi:hypothetical protein